MNHGGIHIPYNMKCATCNHDASDHWISYNGVVVSAGVCYSCSNNFTVGRPNPEHSFKFDNLNYVEVMAERREQEKGLV